jgi:hypothetical protein
MNSFVVRVRAKPHLEGGGDRRQTPPVANINEHPQAAAAGDVVRIARDGKELVKRRVADGQFGSEHAVHRAGSAEHVLGRQHGVAAAQERAVPPRHEPLLVTQNDMAIVAPSGREKGEFVAVQGFPMQTPSVVAQRPVAR